jgi:hypothetical protein
MRQMHLSVIATRQKTGSVRRSVHAIPMRHGGPQRTIEHFASRLSDYLSNDWTLNVKQITSHEFDIFRDKLTEIEAVK